MAIVNSKSTRRKRRQLECEQLVIRDRQGKRRIVLGTNRNGDVRIDLFDPAGERMVAILAEADGERASVELIAPAGNASASLAAVKSVNTDMAYCRVRGSNCGNKATEIFASDIQSILHLEQGRDVQYWIERKAVTE